MADVRSVPAAPATPTRPLPAARAQAIAAAQRAFFDQALASAPATAPARASPAEPVAPAVRATPLRLDLSGPPPERPLRPGSLLDIKV